MTASRGLRDKLVRASFLLLGVLGIFIGAVVGTLELYLAERGNGQLEKEIEKTLIARGKGLAVGHANVFRAFVQDTALTEMQHTLRHSVQQDDVVYGAFTDHEGKPWAVCSPSMLCKDESQLSEVQLIGANELAKDLDLPLPLLPHAEQRTRRYLAFGQQVIEFAEPVRVEGQLAGMLRYGISTRELDAALILARAQRRTLSSAALILVMAFLLGTMLIAYYWTRGLAGKITRPLEELTAAADRLAHGDHNTSVDIKSDDELEVLGSAFNRMVRDLRVSYSALEENNSELAREIEERRQAQAERSELQNHLIQSQKMEAFGQLAGGVAHDFNNILAVIVGNSELLGELLEETDVPPDVRQFNRSIQDAAERGANLTRQLLTFARKETDNPRAINITEVLRGFEGLLRRLLEENVALKFEHGPNLPIIYADAGRIEQVLMNLCVNARDAMPTGGTITVRTEVLHLTCPITVTTGQVPAGSYLVIETRDSGVGMAPDLIARIFEPFFTTKGAGHGTGLGLATVHGIIRSRGGAIQVNSSAGAGTTFKVYLPALEGLQLTEDALVLTDIPGGAGQRVLVCEDELTVREMTEHILKRGGYSVVSVSGPHEALQSLNSSTFDLLITDVIMPSMNGSQLATLAHQTHPQLPILFVSGYTAGVLAAQNLNADGLNFLRKPYRARELLTHVYRLIHGETESN